jgi:hypothetical protein
VAGGIWHLAWRRSATIGWSGQLLAAAVTCLLINVSVCVAQQAPIPASEITSLEAELAKGMRARTEINIRRACKSVARKAAALIEASPEAPNRYAAMAVLFRGQKVMLALENSEDNRAAIFKTCSKLIDAPDQYAKIRFEAEMLLSQRDLAKKNATVAYRVAVLEKLLARYRGTPAEARSLVLVSLIATKLQAFDLVRKTRDRMSERCAGDHDVIALRRKRVSTGRLNAVFSGTYKTAAGGSVTFPHDRMGRQYLIVFWSKKTAGYEELLGRVKEQQKSLPGRFEVYSFNLDELPDAGQSILRKMGLAATAMHLPGGRANSAYRGYAVMDPVMLLVNGQGHVNLKVGRTEPEIGMWLDDERYLAQLGYLFTGDFLVADTGKTGQVFRKTLNAIQLCFPPPPLRYRLTTADALANYKKAEKLCAAAIKQHSAAPDIWVVRNRRIIALLGMWNLAREPKYLAQAVKEARAVLAMDLPPEAQVAARFCVVRDALRRADGAPETLLSRFVAASGGDKAPPSALAAAAILAIEANASTPFRQYRDALLDLQEGEYPTLWPVLSLLRDRMHVHRLFWGNPGRWGYTRTQRYRARGLLVSVPTDTSRLFRAEFKTLGGRKLSFPRNAAGAFTVIVFAEPPADAADKKSFVQSISTHVQTAAGKNAKLTVVFLSEDAKMLGALMKENKWTFQALMAPGGLGNPLVRRLGILSADRVPNVVLLRPDGTIAWTISGLTFPIQGCSVPTWIPIAIPANIEKCEMEAALAAIEKGDFKKALALFDAATQSPLAGVKRALAPWRRADHLHGRALATMGLKDWSAALVEIDAAITQRLKDFGGDTCKCHGVVEMRLTKAIILDKLARANEAQAERLLALGETRPHAAAPTNIEKSGVPVGIFYDRLKRLRLAHWGKKK